MQNLIVKLIIMSIVNEIKYFLCYFNSVIQSLGLLGQDDICFTERIRQYRNENNRIWLWIPFSSNSIVGKQCSFKINVGWLPANNKKYEST